MTGGRELRSDKQMLGNLRRGHAKAPHTHPAQLHLARGHESTAGPRGRSSLLRLRNATETAPELDICMGPISQIRIRHSYLPLIQSTL